MDREQRAAVNPALVEQLLKSMGRVPKEQCMAR
jgi:hypothetical protein